MASTQQHKIPSGFGAKTTADEVLQGIDLTGRLAVVTGGYSGLGTRDHARAGRAPARTSSCPPGAPTPRAEALAGIDGVESPTLDLGDLDSVAAFADALPRLRPLDRHPDRQRRDHGQPARRGSARAGRPSSPPTTSATSRWSTGSGRRSRRTAARAWCRSPRPATAARRSAGTTSHFERAATTSGRPTGRRRPPTSCSPSQLDALGADAGVRAFSLHPGGILTPLQRHLPREEMVGYGWVDEDGNPKPGTSSRRPRRAPRPSVWCGDVRRSSRASAVSTARTATSPSSSRPTRTGLGGVRPYAADPDEAARLWSRVGRADRRRRVRRLAVVAHLPLDRLEVPARLVEMGQDLEAVRLEDLQARLLGPRARAHEVRVLAHAPDRHPGGAQLRDQLDPAEVGVAVAAVTRHGPVDLHHQPGALVVAQRVGGQAGDAGGVRDGEARRRWP